MDCPKCGLSSPPGAQRCDCGYDFVSKTMRASYLPPVKPRPHGSMERWVRKHPATWTLICGAMFLAAAALTFQIAESYVAASPGVTGTGVGRLGDIMGLALVTGVLGVAGLIAMFWPSSRVAGSLALVAGAGGFFGVSDYVFQLSDYIFSFY